jgi:aminopeptidase N
MKSKFFYLIVVTFFAFTVEAQTARPDFNRASTYDVQHYVLRVSFDREKKKVIGDTTVRLKPLKDGLREVVLDSVDISYTSVTLDPGGTALKYKTEDDKIVVTLDRSYTANETVVIRFQYSATPRKGIYFIPEKRQPDNTKVHSSQIWTQGEPDEARHWFPSFDFPSDKATTEQFITAEKGETVVGNGDSVEEIGNQDGTVTHHFKMPVLHSTYLVSFVIGEYSKTSGKFKDIPLGYYVYPGKEAIVPKAFGKTRDVLRVFEELTGIAFPYTKYDQTIVSGFTFGGMENITATSMADTEIFLADFPFGQSAVENLVSHEAAHSWFGNLVTCENWAELWLNEGFATFMEAAYLEKMYGRSAYMAKVVADAETFLADDAINPKRNGLFNRNADNVNALFDRPATTYNKGGAVLHTLREEIGDQAFWKGVNDYLNKYKFANVESTDLRAAMETASGKKLDWFFDQWVYGIGSPKLDVKQAYNQRKKTLTLTIAQTQKTDKFTPAAYRLPIDLDIVTDKGTTTQRLDITKRLATFSFKTDGKPTRLRFDKKEKIPLKTIKIRPLVTGK